MEDKDKIRLIGNKIRMVDPNHFTNSGNVGIFDDRGINTPVHQEDLCISVELTTQSKGRTVLIAENNNGSIFSDNKDNLTINFIDGAEDKTTAGQNYLTTKYTEVSTRLDAIDETLGITSIDIEFNSSYAPMININFVDIKGASIFQSNGDSKYNVFFRLPYPLFQLTVKGYYGKPVTYCLHMLKCNTKFNSQTGNFEISAKFVGYTYALLSDMIIGYIKAAGGTKRGQELLKQKNCPSINSFLTKIADIDKLINSELSSDNQNAVNLSIIKRLRENITNQEILLNTTIGNLKNSVEYPTYDSADVSIVIVKDPDPTTTDGATFADYNNYRTTVKNFEKQYNQLVTDYNTIPSDLSELRITPNLYPYQVVIQLDDVVKGTTRAKEKIKTYYRVSETDTPKIDSILFRLQNAIKRIQKDSGSAWIKFYDFTDISESITTTSLALDEEDKGVSKLVAIGLKNSLASVLGFDPNIRNIVRIFTTHIEVFLQQIFEVSSKYKDQVRVDELKKFTQNLDIKNPSNEKDLIIYPRPEYNKDNVEAYIGGKGVLTNPDNVPEIKFVEELFERMLTDEEILNELGTKVDNGIVSWAAINPIDSYYYNQIMPYDRLDDSATPDDIARLLVLRSVGFLGYSNTYLSSDEIVNFANTEADFILQKFKSSSPIVRGLSEKFNTPTAYADVTGIVNGETRKLLQSDDINWKYDYIKLSPQGSEDFSTYLLPVDTGFNNGVYKLDETTSTETLSSSYCDGGTLTINGVAQPTTIDVSYIDIIERYKYDEIKISSPLMATPSIFNFALLKSETIQSSDVMTQTGFSIGNGKFGIQEFTIIDYSGEPTLGLGQTNFFSLFYDNGNFFTSAVAQNRAKPFLQTWDLLNDKGGVNTFTPLQYTSSDSFVKPYNEIYENHPNREFSLRFFQNINDQDSISYPFFNFATNSGDNALSINLFGSRFYNAQSVHARALLFLHIFPWRGLINKTEKDEIGIFKQKEILNAFRYRTGFVQVPKLLPAFIGGLIWRYEIGGKDANNTTFISSLKNLVGSNGVDPVIFKSGNDWLLPAFYGDDGNITPETYQYLKYYVDKSGIFSNLFSSTPNSNLPMSFNGTDDIKYANLESEIYNLPKSIKQAFVDEFNRFVTEEFNNTNDFTKSLRYIFEVNPVNVPNGLDEAWVDTFKIINQPTCNVTTITNNLNLYGDVKFVDRYSIFAYFYNPTNYQTASIDYNFNNNYLIEYKQGSDVDIKLKELFFDYKYISNKSWRVWNNEIKEGFNNGSCFGSVKINKDKAFATYINVINEKLKGAVAVDGKKKFENNELEQVKFEIYRNLKKIYDKWVAFTDNPDKILFQCCTTNGVTPSRLEKDKAINKHIADVNLITSGDTELDLIDSFRFITRSFRDIGDEFQINPLMVFQLLRETTNISFYDFIGRILTQNNFDFIALPTYIDYNNENELLSVFKPYSYYDAKTMITQSGPSFVCVYVGQTSTKLDFNGTSPYPNDGFNLTDDVSGLPKDLTLTGATWEDVGAAFVVNYGQQNQNIFKDVSLDQSEFGETAESLQITDTIANKLSQSNQTYVGQNLYNVFSVRSYKTEIEMLGDAMIQPMMYFQLDNIPMFRGAYLITKVKHNIVPNHMTTTFTGTRIKANETPLIDVATLYSAILNGYDLPEGKLNSKLTSSSVNYGKIPRESTAIGNIVVNYVESTPKQKSNGPFKGGNPEYIVLHWTAGSKFVPPPDPRGLGYHLEIDVDGTIYQTGDFTQKVSHAGCFKKSVACAEMNGKAIGISYVGGIEKTGTENTGYVRTWADWQNTNLSLGNGTYNAKAQWDGIVNAIILAKEKHPTINAITSHHLTAADKVDIGDDFPWEKLLDEIEAKTTAAGTKWRPLLATKWYDDSNTNQGALVHDFRGRVKKEDILSNLTQLEVEKNQPSNVVVPDSGLKLADVYNYLHSAGLSKNLTLGIMGNMFHESQFIPTVAGDKRGSSVVTVNNTSYNTLRNKNGNYYCSWGLTGINVCGGAGVEFLKRNNLVNGTNEQKISALTNATLHMDYVIYATKKLYPNTYMTEKTPEEWAIKFAMDYENCSDCGSPQSKEVRERAATARTLSTQNFFG